MSIVIRSSRPGWKVLVAGTPGLDVVDDGACGSATVEPRSAVAATNSNLRMIAFIVVSNFWIRIRSRLSSVQCDRPEKLRPQSARRVRGVRCAVGVAARDRQKINRRKA